MNFKLVILTEVMGAGLYSGNAIQSTLNFQRSLWGYNKFLGSYLIIDINRKTLSFPSFYILLFLRSFFFFFATSWEIAIKSILLIPIVQITSICFEYLFVLLQEYLLRLSDVNQTIQTEIIKKIHSNKILPRPLKFKRTFIFCPSACQT